MLCWNLVVLQPLRTESCLILIGTEVGRHFRFLQLVALGLAHCIRIYVYRLCNYGNTHVTT